MGWSVDERFAPIYLLKAGGAASDDELETYVDQIDRITKALVGANKRAVSIVMTDVTKADSNERARLAKAHERLSREQTHAFAASFVVITNPLLRGALTALSWMMRERMGIVRPMRSFDAAYGCALETLQVLGLPTPADLPALRTELGMDKAKLGVG
jgi:hypothetical protein